MNSTNHEDSELDSECGSLVIIGVYLTILFVLAIIFNTLNLWVFHKAKLFNPINCFMMTLIGLNLISTFFELPPIMHSSFHCQYVETT